MTSPPYNNIILNKHCSVKQYLRTLIRPEGALRNGKGSWILHMLCYASVRYTFPLFVFCLSFFSWSFSLFFSASSPANHSPEGLAKGPICFVIFTSPVPNWLEGIWKGFAKGRSRPLCKSGHKLWARTELIKPPVCNCSMTSCHPITGFVYTLLYWI